MISAKKLIKLAKKWQKLAALRRKRIALPQMETSSCRTSEMADKGHFVVYSADQKRFLLPLNYLKNEIVRELLQLAEEEFGLPSNGPLTLPCDAELVEYVIGLIKQGITRDLEKALLVFIASSRCSLFSDLHHHQVTDHQLPICSF
ncbi:auxin-responsive protein [Salix suchowensis]|nr:auxin-responsive protein [Salix suchowensis]